MKHLAFAAEGGRKSLPHDPPHLIGTSAAVFFVTICCKPKAVNQLCYPDVASKIFVAARHYHDLHHWSLPPLLLMPDHLHILASFSCEAGMTKTVRTWKRYIAAQHRIRWQRDFFDHRLRSDESLTDKARYVLDNQIRAGLVERAEDWPYQTAIK
jgi:putative transposase